MWDTIKFYIPRNEENGKKETSYFSDPFKQVIIVKKLVSQSKEQGMWTNYVWN